MARSGPDYVMERTFGGRVAGLDEAGRGPLAGPVVAAAVMFGPDGPPADLASHLDDSKRVPAPVRTAVFDRLNDLARDPDSGVAIAVHVAGTEEIERRNILHAALFAMAEAAAALQPAPDRVLIDGNRIPPGLACPATAVVKGDNRCYSIAAASIIAKVTRDRLMAELDAAWPGYGFARHKGYGTPAHLEALARLGPCPAHRRGFRPVQDCLPGFERGLARGVAS